APANAIESEFEPGLYNLFLAVTDPPSNHNRVSMKIHNSCRFPNPVRIVDGDIVTDETNQAISLCDRANRLRILLCGRNMASREHDCHARSALLLFPPEMPVLCASKQSASLDIK